MLDVFRELQERLGFACMFVTHDLAVVDTLCDRVVVLHGGRVAEEGACDAVLRAPQTPVPRAGSSRRRRCRTPVEQAARRSARLASLSS